MSATNCVYTKNRQPICPLDQEAISQNGVSQLLLCLLLNESTLKSLLKYAQPNCYCGTTALSLKHNISLMPSLYAPHGEKQFTRPFFVRGCGLGMRLHTMSYQ